MCGLDVAPVRFSTTDSLSSGTYDTRGMLTVNCTGSKGAAIAACADLGQGVGAKNSANQRLLISQGKGHTLPIQIFQDVGLTKPWGYADPAQAPILTRIGDGVMSATIYIRLYVQKGAAMPGTYAAQFPVTLRYGTVQGYGASCGGLGSAVAAAPIIGHKR